MTSTARKKPAVRTPRPVTISTSEARAMWLTAQRLTEPEPFGAGPDAVRAAIEHLGYVQIDTINVIERCHHHILYNRIPAYRRADLAHAQSEARSVFEYWTHALSYVPVRDLRFYTGTMRGHRKDPAGWGGQALAKDLKKVLTRIRDEGALAISDITDDVLVEKEHLWASRKPSKRALQAGFYGGRLVISRRDGMLKTYELTERHFGERLPAPASPTQTLRYVLDRALTAQGIVSLDSICFNNTYARPSITKADMLALVEKEVRAKRLKRLRIDGLGRIDFFARPETLDAERREAHLTHILSPFDPMMIQRKRTEALFGYKHLFEAYVPKAKRQMGYFTLPVLVGDAVVAALDLKADRQTNTLQIQAWHWVGSGNAHDHKQSIETELDRFARFQFAD